MQQKAGWRSPARRAGYRGPAVCSRRRRSRLAARGHHRLVLGDRCFGNVDPALADQACRLAAAANVELLAVTFSHAAAGATFLGAQLWPDVSLPELAAALLARFVRAAGRAAANVAEAAA